MKATAAPAIEHQSSSTALHAGKQGNTAFFGPAAGNEAPFFAPRIQTKLTIGRPGDKYEQEADAVADRVVQRLANPGATIAVQKKCQDCEEKEKLQRKEEEREEPPVMRQVEDEQEETPKVQAKEKEEEEPRVMRQTENEQEEAPPVQTKEKEEEEKPVMRQAGAEEEEPLQAKAEAGASTTPSLQSRLSSAKGAGAQMDKSARTPMEAAFGQDFGQVRIHTDSGATQMNRELNARAFTHGRDIYFNAGEYSPGSTEGRRLLAHELVHVGQQGGRDEIIQHWHLMNRIIPPFPSGVLFLSVGKERLRNKLLNATYFNWKPFPYIITSNNKFARNCPSKDDIINRRGRQAQTFRQILNKYFKCQVTNQMLQNKSSGYFFPDGEYAYFMGFNGKGDILTCNIFVCDVINKTTGISFATNSGSYAGNYITAATLIKGIGFDNKERLSPINRRNEVKIGDIFAKGTNHMGFVKEISGANFKRLESEYNPGEQASLNDPDFRFFRVI